MTTTRIPATPTDRIDNICDDHRDAGADDHVPNELFLVAVPGRGSAVLCAECAAHHERAGREYHLIPRECINV